MCLVFLIIWSLENCVRVCVWGGCPAEFSKGAVTKYIMILRLSWNVLSIVVIRLGKILNSCLLEGRNNKFKICSVYKMI